MIKNILAISFICALVNVPLARDAARIAQEDDIREVVFRYQFDHNASGQGKKAAVYCVSVGERPTDPSENLIKRFVNHKPPVRKLSECNIDIVKGVVDKRTGLHGLVFRVTSITWISDTEVKATGGYYEDGLSASGNTYSLRKSHGIWEVSKNIMNWIS